ncbi:MAG: amidohydrolase family protein [Pseudomonadota bacterium]
MLSQNLHKGLMTFMLSSLLASCVTIEQTALPQYRLDNGLWFNGETFEPQTAYVIGNSLQFSPSETEAADIIDLDGAYVVPPFCEAHNHNIGGRADGVEEVVQAYLNNGIFYAMMPGSFALYREQIADKINKPDSVDVVFANNGLTGSGGHPRKLREFLKRRYGRYPEFTNATFADKGYFEADTLDEVYEKWALILAEKPDFIKVMLLYSEEYQERKDDPEYYGLRGLNPEFLPEVVRLAQAENLRVAVHVNTDFDMAMALRAGVDIIAHMPSYRSPLQLSDETIALAKETNAIVVTTLSLAKRFEQRDPESYAATIAAQRDNLKRAHAAGVNLVIGSDNTRGTSRGEAEHIASLDVLDNRTLLNMWTTRCAEAVFPGRKIGRLIDGYEASFVVLEGDPLADFDNTGRISLRMKEGQLLGSSEPKAPQSAQR